MKTTNKYIFTCLRPARTKFGSALLFVLVAGRLAAGTISFTTLPADGNVAGPAGSIVGWGYAITNNSGSDWFVSASLNPDSSFSLGIPALLFDFPNLAPGTTATENFDPVNGAGLFELTIDPSAVGGSNDSGNFQLSGEWWDGDPLNGGNFISTAVDVSTLYAAIVSQGSSQAPEPAGVVLVLAGLAVLAASKGGLAYVVKVLGGK